MRPLRYAAATAAGLACTAPAAAQRAEVQVSLRPLAPLDAFYLADLVPGTAASRPELLGITLVTVPLTAYNRSPDKVGSAAAQPGAAVTDGGGPAISLEIVVAREAPSPAQIFRGTTDPFVLSVPVRH